MNPIALNSLSIDLDWSQFLKYREMPVFEQVSLRNDPKNPCEPRRGCNTNVKIRKVLEKSYIINSIA